MDLAEFLLARIAEDEAVARAAGAESPTPWRDDEGTLKDADETSLAGYAGEATSPHIARWDPARVFAECATKRAIVELHKATPLPEGDWRPGKLVCAHDDNWWPCETLAYLALPYAVHPDYEQEWKP